MSASSDFAVGRPVCVIREGELDLAAPPEVAWPLVLDIPAWQNYKKFEHVSGPVGGEGELLALLKDEPGSGKTPYVARTALLQPGKRIIWKFVRDAPEPGDAALGIVDFSIAPAPEGSRFRYTAFYECVTTDGDEHDWARQRATYHGNFSTLFDTIMPKLQQLVEDATA
ncbi:SRPBCC family protein [Amycolatopsis panacis]|uniref:SRPBCC family protein n=1 Tax=Amycolatopsis panacis TaxID=2340917 RepID=UPI001313ED61|nr:SRPBCC family protein [Amycolatopsis panacis]